MIPIATPCTIVRLTASGVNSHGETEYDVANVETVCHLNITSTDEETSPDQRAEAAGTVYLSADETLDEHDRLVIDGVSWEVNGVPVPRRRAPTGQVHHLEVPVKVAR